MAVNVVDQVGNNYGGTSFNQSGVGDIVQDVQGIQATVLKMINNNGVWLVNAYTLNSGDGSRHEVTAQANSVTIVSHQDGTGLVAGVGAVSPGVLGSPIGQKYFQKSF